jgi:hypothetical protein
VLGWKKGKGQGVRAKRPSSSSPPSRSRTEEGQGGLGRRRATTPQGSATAGERGKAEGESRGSQPRAHLGPGLLVEAALRRRAAAGYGGRGGGAWRLGEGSEAVVEVRGAQGFFIGAGWSVRGRYFELASSNGRQWWFGKNPGVDSGRRDLRSIRRCVT